MVEHDMRPECAENFGSIRSDLTNLREESRERRNEYRAILDVLTAVREDVARLQVRARGWGAIGGLFAALVTLGIAAVVAAFG